MSDSTRKQFIGLAALAPLAALMTGATADSGLEPAEFDKAAFLRLLQRPATHRQVFAAAKVRDGAALHCMMNSLNAYHFGFGEGDGSLRVALVLYGLAPPLALDDAMWAKCRLAELLRGLGDSGSRRGYQGSGNPFAAARSPLDRSASPDDANGLYRDQSVQALVFRGASIFVCNVALTGLAAAILANETSDATRIEATRVELAGHLVPGSMLVPAGVAALNAAQENRFTFFQATL